MFEDWLRGPVKHRKAKPKSALARSVEQVLRANFEPAPIKLPPAPPTVPVQVETAQRATIEARATVQVGDCACSSSGTADWSAEEEELMLLF